MTPEGYQPLQGRATWVQRALILGVAVDLVSILSGFLEYRLYQQDLVTQDELDATDIRSGLIGFAQFAIFVWAVVAFIRWFKRAYANLEPLGAALRFRKGWTIWSWFVPILNWFRPKQIANDIWRASDPEAPPRQHEYAQRDVPTLFFFWWGTFLISNALYNVAFRVSWRANEISEYSDAAVAYLFSDSLSAICGILAVFLVRRTTDRQEERARRLAAEGPAGSEPGPAVELEGYSPPTAPT